MITVLRRHPVLTAAFVLALLLALGFGVRVVVHTVRWQIYAEEPVAPWMTVGFVGHSWHVDPRAIDALAGLPTPDQTGRPLTLAQIAAQRGVPVATVIASVESALATLRDGAP